MKIIEKYYRKIYKHTEKLLKKVLGLNVMESMVEFNSLKKKMKDLTGKEVEEINTIDLIENKLSFDYAKYCTLKSILDVISGVAFLSTFYTDEIEELKNEGK